MERAATAASRRRAPCFVSPHSNGSDVAHRHRRSGPAVPLRPWRDRGGTRPKHANANQLVEARATKATAIEYQEGSYRSPLVDHVFRVDRAYTSRRPLRLFYGQACVSSRKPTAPCAHSQYLYVLNQNHTFRKKNTRQRHHVPHCLLRTYMQTYIFYVGRYGSALFNEVIKYDICSVSVFALHACNHTYVVSSVTALHETSTTSSHGPANSLMRNSST